MDWKKFLLGTLGILTTFLNWSDCWTHCSLGYRSSSPWCRSIPGTRSRWKHFCLSIWFDCSAVSDSVVASGCRSLWVHCRADCGWFFYGSFTSGSDARKFISLDQIGYYPMDLKRTTKNLQSVKLRNVGEGIVVHESDCVQSQFQESQFVEHRKLELVLLGEVVAE